MTANMNFGPEWMRGGLPQRSNTMDSHSSQSTTTLSPNLTTSLSSSKENEQFGGDNDIVSQDNNLFKYSRDFMLSLYRPMDVPAHFEKLTHVAVDEPIGPLAFVDLTEDEKRLLSGPVHVEPTRRMANSTKDAGNGQRYHRGNDHYSADNGSGRPMNRVKGRQGLEHRREASAESGVMKNGDGQTDGIGNDNIGRNNNNNSWGNRDAFGSWGESLNGNGDGGFTSDNKDTVPLSWSQSSGSGDNGMGLKPDVDPSVGSGPSLSDDVSSSPDKHPSQYKWYYRDPTNNIQGPFGAQEMQDWYKAGFFGPSLWVRREDQDHFEPLAAFIVKIGNEDVFMSQLPMKKPVADPLAGMSSSFRPVSDPFGRSGGPGPLFGGGVSSPGLNSPGGLFGNNQATDILTPGLGKYSPFGNSLNQGPGSNPDTPSLPLASPFGNNDTNVFGAPFLGRDSGSPWSERPATPSWLNNSQSDLFGSTFQRQSQQLHSPLYHQQQNQQQQPMQPIMNPLFQQQRGLGGDSMDSQQQFAQMLQQRQQSMMSQPFQLQQQDLPSLHDQPTHQPHIAQNQLLGQLSNHASPVIRPAALNGWGSSPGTPLATEAPSSPWGSIVSPAIPQNVSEEIQAKAPGQQSPRSHLSPQVQHVTLPSTTSAPPKAINSPPPPAAAAAAFTTVKETTTITNVQEQRAISPAIETIKSSLGKISLHDIQQEQESQRKQKEEMLRRQLEKEQQAAAAAMAQKKLEAQRASVSTTKDKPSIPQPITPKKVSLLDIQQEEMKKQQEVKKQAKANSKMASSLLQEQQSLNGNKSGWSASGSGWANDSYKGPSLREIQEMEAKEAQRKKEAEQRSVAQQQYASPTSTPTTLSWGVVTPSKNSTLSNTTTSSSSAGAAWGGAAAPKKTLREIQLEEEETMRKKTLKQQQQAIKTGYSAMTSVPVDDGTWTKVVPKPKQTSTGDASTISSRNDGWDVVGAPKKPVVLNPPSAVAPRPMVVTQQRKSNDPNGPSDGFKLWCKQSLRDLSPGVNADEIFKMLLSFPVDNSVGEIIQDIIYANSTSMDGRRFAAEFLKRRRVDMANNANAKAPSLPTSISAPVISSVEDDSFQVVNKKGKKNKPM
ncbi:hypothetical protein BC941DRAFT_413194 [Chlamydoabsidia padenii]|nr:hypothetical protein BC941DRAFT_413194 [Chlamydoabsidia padenii]